MRRCIVSTCIVSTCCPVDPVVERCKELLAKSAGQLDCVVKYRITLHYSDTSRTVAVWKISRSTKYK